MPTKLGAEVAEASTPNESKSTPNELMNPIVHEGTAAGPGTSSLEETTQVVTDASGYHLQLEEIRSRQIGLSWGMYTNPTEQVTTFHPRRSTVVSHFRLSDSQPFSTPNMGVLKENQFVVYQEPGQPYDLCLPPTTDTPRHFFELSLSNELFASLITEESAFLSRFSESNVLPTPTLTYSHWMVPAMYTLIDQMRQSPYHGYLKGVYLEAKAIELFLLQVQRLDGVSDRHPARLSGRDIDCLQAVKRYIDQHYDQPGSLLVLAKQVGINQQKLKVGFKALFNTTVFGYVSEVRLQTAHQLLVDEKLPVYEVAERVGYKNAHHFTAAFKRSYGYLPKDLKG